MRVPRRRSPAVPSAGGRWRLVFLLVAAVLAAGCTAGADEITDLEITGFAYQPERVEVAAGTTVRWTNRDRPGHTVTSGAPRSPTGEFDGELGRLVDGQGKTFRHRFESPGTYPYYCVFHPSMVGEVIVTAGS